jgi:hypothetical protein
MDVLLPGGTVRAENLMKKLISGVVMWAALVVSLAGQAQRHCQDRPWVPPFEPASTS